MYGEYHILSSRLLLIVLREYDKAHLTHLLLEEVVGPRDICQEVLSHISERCLATAVRVFLNQNWTSRTKRRRGSKASGFRKQ